MNAPPVVGEHVEHAQDEDEESGRPLGLESYRNHTARCQPHDRHQESPNAPLALDHEPQEEEDEQDPTGKKEAANSNEISSEPIHLRCCVGHFLLLFLSVVFADGWKSGERSSSGNHRIAEDHE